MRPNRSLARGYLATVAFALVAAAACSGRDRAEGTNGTTFKPPTEQLCSPGQVRECGIEIGRAGDTVDCAKGTQTCLESKAWSECAASGGTFKAKAPPTKSGSGAIGTNAVGGSATTCIDNPCNPDCKTFNDSPDTGIVSDAVVTTTVSEGVLLSESNVPGGFQNKGTLDSQCTSGAGTQAYMEACQFDMKCGTKSDGTAGCVPFASGEKNACSGIDITAPPVCVSDETLSYRNLTICNRGSVDLAENIQCMGYPGNSPQYPDASPGAGLIVLQTGSTVDPSTGAANPISATNPLKAGTCRVYHVPNTNFQSSGTMSIMCNPPATGTPVTTTIDTYPLTASTTQWTDPDKARDPADSLASATVSFNRVGLTARDAGGQANATGFSSPDNIVGAADSSFAEATSSETTSAASAASTVDSNTCSGSGCTTWQASSGLSTIGADVTTADGVAAYASIPKSTSSTLQLSGLSFASIPAASIISGMQITVRASVGGRTYGTVSVEKTDGTVVGSATITATGTTTVNVTLAYGTVWQWELSSLKVKVTAARDSSGSGYDTFGADYVGVAFKYFAYQHATIDATTYGSFGAIPAGAVVEGFELTPTWKTSLAAADAYVLMYVRGADGSYLGGVFTNQPAGYTAGTVLNTPVFASAWTTVTDAHLAAGFKVETYIYRFGGTGSVTTAVDSIRVRPIYRTTTAYPSIKFGNFGVAVPSGATNIRVTTFVNYQVAPRATEDYLYARTWSGLLDGSGTWISSGSVNPSNDAFNLYQLGAATVTDATLLEDSKLFAQVIAYKSGSSATIGTTTGSLDYVTLRLQYDATVGASVAECNPYNNWTVNKANPPTMCAPVTTVMYPPWTQSRVFEATCADTNYRPRWRLFGYTSTTPAGSKIEFRFRTSERDSSGTCPTLAAATADPPTAAAVASLGPPDTQTCSLTATPTTTCPVDLYTKLGNVDANKPCLQMDARGVPATAPATPASPTLTDWRVTYDCVPNE